MLPAQLCFCTTSRWILSLSGAKQHAWITVFGKGVRKRLNSAICRLLGNGWGREGLHRGNLWNNYHYLKLLSMGFFFSFIWKYLKVSQLKRHYFQPAVEIFVFFLQKYILISSPKRTSSSNLITCSHYLVHDFTFSSFDKKKKSFVKFLSPSSSAIMCRYVILQFRSLYLLS